MNKYNLPEIAFAQKDVAIIENEIISKYEELSNRKLAIADPVHLFLKAIILYVVQQRQIIDYTGKQNLLSYAVGINLDYIGLLLGVKRNPSLSATTTIRFTLSAPQISVITIPKGTRITKDSVIFFATNETIEIKAGEKFIDIVATCQSSGIIGNNIKVNELNILVDPVAFIATVSNITDTTGGVDEEDDESFRLRIQEAPDKFSNAGSIGAYQYWTRTYSQKVIDVSVFSPSAGIVNVLPLMINGELPTTEELASIAAILTNDKVRPLTDFVKVLAPNRIGYEIDLTYYISSINSVSVDTIKDKVTKTVKDYSLWQKSKIGRDINPSQLTARIISSGAKRVDLKTPIFSKLENNEVAFDTKINIIYGGLEGG